MRVAIATKAGMWKGGGRREYAARRRRRTQEDVQSQKQKGSNDDVRGCRRERAKFIILRGKINEPATEKKARKRSAAREQRTGRRATTALCLQKKKQSTISRRKSREKKCAPRGLRRPKRSPETFSWGAARERFVISFIDKPSSPNPSHYRTAPRRGRFGWLCARRERQRPSLSSHTGRSA